MHRVSAQSHAGAGPGGGREECWSAPLLDPARSIGDVLEQQHHVQPTLQHVQPLTRRSAVPGACSGSVRQRPHHDESHDRDDDKAWPWLSW